MRCFSTRYKKCAKMGKKQPAHKIIENLNIWVAFNDKRKRKGAKAKYAHKPYDERKNPFTLCLADGAVINFA